MNETLQRLNRQHQKILKIFIRENALTINKRVEKENVKIGIIEKKMNLAIMQHKNDLQMIKGAIGLLNVQIRELEMNVLPNTIFGGSRGRVRKTC